MSTTSFDSIQTEDHDGENSPRLRRQGSMHSMATHYTESSFGSHTDLSGALITRSATSAGTYRHGGTRRQHQKLGSGIPIASERRRRLQQERLSRAARDTEKVTVPALETVFEAGSTVNPAGATLEPVTKSEGKLTFEEDDREPHLGLTAQLRAASAEATARMIHYARELLNASNEEISRLEAVQDMTEHGDGPVPQRRHTTGVLSRRTAARLQSRRATTDGSGRVSGAASDSVSMSKPSEHIQELMAQFDRAIKARVEANIEEQRRQKKWASLNGPLILGEPKDSNLSSNKLAKQDPRPHMTEHDRALSTSETIVVNEPECMDDAEVQMARGSSVGLKDADDKVGYLNRTTSMEDEAPAGLDLSVITSYDEGIVIPEHAVAATMVPVSKARLVKVTRSGSVRHSRRKAGATQSPPGGEPSQVIPPNSPYRIETKSHLAAGQNSGDPSARVGLDQRDVLLAQLLQPVDFVISTDSSEKRPTKTERDHSRSTSPFQRPSAALSCRFKEHFEEQFEKFEEHSQEKEEKEEQQEEEDTISLSSVDCATDAERIASSSAPLFNMPNSPFLYHIEEEDECPSLTTDDDQDRRTEEIRLGGQDRIPPPPSSPLKLGHGFAKSKIPVREMKGWTNDTKPSASPDRLGEEVEFEGFSGTGDSFYQGEYCDDCEGYWVHGTEEHGQGVKRCSYSAAADQWRRSNRTGI
ncbi:hypothetical protein VMCG_07784 [Cytospora schulzeri]|uniref:Uncharacterized protein n=1 Tax=Cytospora schulzeri TaxID=448051 RepID=A0A423VZV1_9PEZI|nr:hypothetical protein VMCG_07784 [Valsa malicola]